MKYHYIVSFLSKKIIRPHKRIFIFLTLHLGTLASAPGGVESKRLCFRQPPTTVPKTVVISSPAIAVPLEGFEPPFLVPKTSALSIELQGLGHCGQAFHHGSMTRIYSSVSRKTFQLKNKPGRGVCFFAKHNFRAGW